MGLNAGSNGISSGQVNVVRLALGEVAQRELSVVESRVVVERANRLLEPLILVVISLDLII